MTDIARPSSDTKRVATVGLAIIVGTFGVLGLWAALTPLNSAVIGHGVVSLDTNRQIIQHYEGGIIRQILVHEGDKVARGQQLFQLDSVQPNANLDITKNQLYHLQARVDRLTAEEEGKPAVTFSDVLTKANDPIATLAMSDERTQFQERRATLESQEAILTTRISEYQTEIQGLNQQQSSSKEQVGFINDELNGLAALYKQDLVPKPRLLALDRERAQLEGQIGGLVADKARAEKSIGETQLQMRQLRDQFSQDVSKEQVDVQTQLGDARQRFIVAQDAAKRVDIVAPVAGTIQNLRVSTVGAVIRPGDPLVEIAPSEGNMEIQARFSPNDVDSVHPGQKVQLRFSSFHSRTIPVIQGVIKSVSQDRLADEATHVPYYLAIINLSDTQLPPELKGKLRAGLPADVTVPTGSRTALQYIWQPLTNALRQSGREQ